MNNEEKILAVLEKHGEMLEKLSERMDKMDARMDKIDARMDQMQDNIHLINVRLDLDVGKRLDALAEGQSVIGERLDAMEGTLAGVKELAEKTSDKVDVIHAVVSQHSGAITELKKARG